MPRSLMVPPGIPEFMTRRRFVDGPCVLEGRAWSGWAPIARRRGQRGRRRVLGAGGARAAPLAPRLVALDLPWDDPAPGEHVLVLAGDGRHGARPAARDALEHQGLPNNAVERIPVTVR